MLGIERTFVFSIYWKHKSWNRQKSKKVLLLRFVTFVTFVFYAHPLTATCQEQKSSQGWWSLLPEKTSLKPKAGSVHSNIFFIYWYSTIMQNIKKSLSSHCIIIMIHGIGRKKTHCGNERAINDQIGQEVTYHPLIEVFTNLFLCVDTTKWRINWGWLLP